MLQYVEVLNTADEGNECESQLISCNQDNKSLETSSCFNDSHTAQRLYGLVVWLRLAGKLCNVFSSHSGISHSRQSHSLEGLRRGHVCDHSTIKQHPCVTVSGQTWAPQGDTHCLSLPVCTSHVVLDQKSCAYYLQTSAVSILASNKGNDQFDIPAAKSQETFTVSIHNGFD